MKETDKNPNVVEGTQKVKKVKNEQEFYNETDMKKKKSQIKRKIISLQ